MINRIAVIAISAFFMTLSTATFGVGINTADVSKFVCVPVNSWKVAGVAAGASVATAGGLGFVVTRFDLKRGLVTALFGALHSTVTLGLLKAVPNNPWAKASVLAGLPLLETLISDSVGEKVFIGIFGAASSLATLGALNYMNA